MPTSFGGAGEELQGREPGSAAVRQLADGVASGTLETGQVRAVGAAFGGGGKVTSGEASRFSMAPTPQTKLGLSSLFLRLLSSALNNGYWFSLAKDT